VQRDSQAEASLQKALSLEPANMDYLYALADFYLKRNRLAEAKKVAEKMVAAHSDQRVGKELLEIIERGHKNQSSVISNQ
jgi:predicted Zn-dependent protease